jgi:cellulose synthase/poly-beta-1,6-N-acetylglucosamine synthase-like glycosyltransferase
MAQDFLIFIYASNVFFLLLMGLHAYVACFHFFQGYARRRKNPLTVPKGITLPSLLIQLPIYNEENSVLDLLDSIDSLDYPADRLKVQILDDSDDEGFRMVSDWLGSNKPRFETSHLRREVRTGFKAGALKFGLSLDSSPFVAIFDADFRPRPDFIKRAIVQFHDREDLGLVQGRWGYINQNASFWTRFQAVGMDGHFAIEQPARAWNGFFMNFNGTAGVWRREAILDAGDWEGDTLTEDLDLSYRSQLKGWKLDYDLDLECPSEIPESIFAFKSQQFRWAKGSIQTFLKLMPRILKSGARVGQKIESVFHLTHYLIHPLLVMNFLLGCYIIFNPEILSRYALQYLFILILFTSLGPSALYHLSQRVLGKRVRGGPFFYLLMISLGCGMAWNNTRAVIQAIFGVESPFVRTPKVGDFSKVYLPPQNFQFIVEILLGTLGAFTLANASSGFYFLVPFLSLYTIGFLIIGWGSCFEWLQTTAFQTKSSFSIPSSPSSIYNLDREL